MKISDTGLEIIKKFEGFRGHPYRDVVGVCTIGYGTTHYEDGRPVRCSDVPISKERATEIMRHEIDHHYGNAVDHYVGRHTTQAQFDALVSFAYNLGVGALKKSSLLRHHNARNHDRAANEFRKWVHAGGRTLPGLVRRRQMEKDLYLA